MNKEMLAKYEGHIVRLGPVARRLHGQQELELIDDDWRISKVDPIRKVVEIHNQRCDHCPSWFTEGFDTADLKEARALLDELTTH